MSSTFLAYTLTSSFMDSGRPYIRIGSGGSSNNEVFLRPETALKDSYWIVILNAQNPRQKVKDWIVPGDNNAVPAGIETFMDNPAYIFAVLTGALLTQNVPLDAFYNFLAKYGAGPQLQKLEQLHSTMGYGVYGGRVAYILTGPCGPRTPVPPESYEAATWGDQSSYSMPLMLSLQSMPNGQPPYGITEAYTWIPRMPRGQSMSEEQ